MGIIVYGDECRAAGLDPTQVGRIARHLDSAARDARKLGLIVADMSSGCWDGGDGGAVEIDGLLRGGRHMIPAAQRASKEGREDGV